MLKDLITASRSYRSFDPNVRISRAQLADFIDCARLSPSSVNLQMLKFRPVTNNCECEALLSLTRWAGKIKDRKLPPEGHAPTAYIVICTDENVVEHAERFQKDVGIAAQSVMLAAAEAGFGGCMIGSFSPEGVAKALALPEGILPQLVLALGKPDETVRLVPPAPDGSVTYYRDGDLHCVQKRPLDEVIIGDGKHD